MSAPEPDAVIFGMTHVGGKFRPSDWNERLAGLTSAFGADHKLAYSPLVCPMGVQGVQTLVVGGTLAQVEPRLWQFLLQFARDNDLIVARLAGALAQPGLLQAPAPARAVEPREPV